MITRSSPLPVADGRYCHGCCCSCREGRHVGIGMGVADKKSTHALCRRRQRLWSLVLWACKAIYYGAGFLTEQTTLHRTGTTMKTIMLLLSCFRWRLPPPPPSSPLWSSGAVGCVHACPPSSRPKPASGGRGLEGCNCYNTWRWNMYVRYTEAHTTCLCNKQSAPIDYPAG